MSRTDSPLRVLLVSHFYPPEVGAPQRRLKAFVEHWRRRGVEVRVVTSLPHYPSGRMPPRAKWTDYLGTRDGEFGESIVRVPYLPSRSPNGTIKMLDHAVVAAGSVPAALRGPRPNVVLVTVLGLPSIATARLAARRWGVPLVIEMRDAWPDLLFKSGFGDTLLTRALARLVTRAQRNADRVVSVTTGFIDVLAARGVPRARLMHIPNGIDPNAVPMLPSPTPDGPLRVLYLGTHGVSQGLEVAVQALAAVGGDVVQARFIGEGAEKDRLQQLAETLGAPIRFENPAVGDALWRAYEWAETCLVPLQPWEAFEHTVPSKLYEVMATGRHITAALSGEAAAVVREGSAGVVVPPGDVTALADALRQVAADRGLVTVGQGPRRWVAENASYPRLADAYLGLFEALTTSGTFTAPPIAAPPAAAEGHQ